MQAILSNKIHPLLKWSVVTSGIAGLVVGSGVFSIWFVIEILAVLTRMG